MAYDSEVNYDEMSGAIQSDLILNATDITSVELIDDATGVKVPVIKEIDGVPKVRRVGIDVLTAEARSAASQALARANQAQIAAVSAQSAADNASEAATSASEAAQNATIAIEDFQSQLDAYLASTNQQVKSRLVELGQMATEHVLDVKVDSIQLFDDFVVATGFTGTYNDFLILLGETGGGGTIDVDDAISSTSVNPVQNKVISSALNGKQDTLSYLTASEINEIINLI